MEEAFQGIDGGVILAFQGGGFGSAGKVDHNVRHRSFQNNTGSNLYIDSKLVTYTTRFPTASYLNST